MVRIEMNWNEYKDKVISEGASANKSSEYIASYLTYAQPLFEQNVPIITESSHFSMLVGFTHEYICRMAYGANSFYRHFTIKKSNGKDRNIDEPLPDLKCVQKWILQEILYKIPVSKYAKAFVPGQSLKHNVRFHRAQDAVVTVDVKDFFPTINIKRIHQVFLNIGYKDKIAWFLSNLCCLNNSLPQGAPTSPCLSNIVMRGIDHKLGEYCLSKKYRYTRYADDLTFSGDKSVIMIIPFVSNLLYENGFTLNPTKTRVAKKNARQEITGIVVNEHLQIPKSKRKVIRQEIYYIEKFGLDSHLNHINETRQNYLRHLLGKVNFACFINPKDNEMQRYYDLLKALYLEQINRGSNNAEEDGEDINRQ